MGFTPMIEGRNDCLPQPFNTTLALDSRCYSEALMVVCRVMRPRRWLWPDAWIAERRDPFAVSCVDAFACGEGMLAGEVCLLVDVMMEGLKAEE